MAMTDAESLFVDTNVLVYAAVAEASRHESCLHFLRHHSETGGSLVVSRQVLREFMAVMTRPQTSIVPIHIENILWWVRMFQETMAVCDDDLSVGTRLLQLCSEVPLGGKQIHDANIVATMLAFGVKRLVTYNLVDFRRFQHYIHLMTPES